MEKGSDIAVDNSVIFFTVVLIFYFACVFSCFVDFVLHFLPVFACRVFFVQFLCSFFRLSVRMFHDQHFNNI